ncbi:MAG TPA: DUF1287 domain-containing protein, partial [Thermoanaerobaculia bacterium]|nr:DUF1287 domain-containing protein [Thermoanaerobaculia bacterium]
MDVIRPGLASKSRLRRRAAVAFLFALVAALAAAQQVSPPGVLVARAAERQVGVTTIYDPAYRRLGYPGGDVPIDRGVCTDVVIRSFRSIGVDLQVELHEDMTRSFDQYPRLWNLSRPDSNIDHRRVPNLMTWFRRQGKEISLEAEYLPGDIVAWRLPNGLHHIGIVST